MDPMLMLKLAQQFKQGGQGQDQQQTGTSQMGAMSQQGGFLQKIMEALKGGGQQAAPQQQGTPAMQAQAMPKQPAGLLGQGSMSPDQIQALFAQMGNRS